ncbi:unnamed protein product [Effrenium voratum]|nr:unnamed protein product [Effrenium voratum]
MARRCRGALASVTILAAETEWTKAVEGPCPGSGWATISWLASASSKRPVISVQVNGASHRPASYKSHRRRRAMNGHRRRSFMLGTVPMRVDVEVGEGPLKLSYGPELEPPKDLLVQLNSAKHKDLTFSDRVVPAGCHNRDGLVWVCAAKNGGNEPALYIKELSLNHWTLRFMMRSKHNQAKTASGIGFKEASGRISWLLTDVSDSKPKMILEKGIWAGGARDLGFEQMEAKVWHQFEIMRAHGYVSVYMDGNMIFRRGGEGWKFEQVVIRSWRNEVTVAQISQTSEFSSLTVMNTLHPKNGNGGRYFNFNMDELNLKANKVYQRYIWQCRKKTCDSGSGDCWKKEWEGTVIIWTKLGQGGADSSGRRNNGNDKGRHGNFEPGDVLTTDLSCNI